jgi:hypothetical protein
VEEPSSSGHEVPATKLYEKESLVDGSPDTHALSKFCGINVNKHGRRWCSKETCRRKASRNKEEDSREEEDPVKKKTTIKKKTTKR